MEEWKTLINCVISAASSREILSGCHQLSPRHNQLLKFRQTLFTLAKSRFKIYSNKVVKGKTERTLISVMNSDT